jgi:hypothetical protein
MHTYVHTHTQTHRNTHIDTHTHAHIHTRLHRKLTEEREREKELELIKQQYLGLNKLKKRIVRPSEKFKFNFDWGAEEDTSKDLNPLYNNPHGAWILLRADNYPRRVNLDNNPHGAWILLWA